MQEQQQVTQVTLHDGNAMPQLGFGVWQVPDAEAASVVQTAIECGYRSIDTAKIYENERGVGEAVRASDVPRAELFITTKLWNSDQGAASAPGALESSLERLGLDYVDLYLIHWPAPQRGVYAETWQALLELRDRGLVRSVGVSNFTEAHLLQIAEASGELPVINQVELHPWFQQRELRAFHDEHGIRTEAWSPLGQGAGLLREPVLADIAAVHGRTPAQVVLRWHLQVGNVVIPKSSTPSRIAENFDVFNFELSAEEMGRLAGLDRHDGRIGPHPDNANF